MKTLITIGIAAIVTLIGTPVLCVPFGDQPPLVVLLVVCLAIGVFIGNRVAISLPRTPPIPDKSHVPNDIRWSQPPTRAPDPFSDRLARFRQRQLNTDADPRSKLASRMPFWMADMNFQRAPPKHSSYIRSVLHRIRSILALSSDRIRDSKKR